MKDLTIEEVENIVSVYADMGLDAMISEFWSWLSR